MQIDDGARHSFALECELRVLLLTAYRYPTTTRLALGLFEAGAQVDVLCPAGHSLERVKFVHAVNHYKPLNAISSIRAAIEASGPDLIIPADDCTAAQLHELYKLANWNEMADKKLRALIAHSLGEPGQYGIFYSRDEIAMLAHSAGVRSPIVTAIRDRDHLISELTVTGFPAVLKSDGSSGGRGVVIAQNQSDAEIGFRTLSHPGVVRALKRLMIDSDATALLPSLRRARSRVSLQRFIFGRRANAAVACREGKVLAHVTVEVLASNGATGPSTVIRVIDNPDISQAVERMARKLLLSGLCGFDFILNSDEDDAAYLIDFNPRATQTCHLVSSDGKQPLSWLVASMLELPVPSKVRNPRLEPIVLFPHGFTLDPQSLYSKYSYSDFPDNTPAFAEIGREFRLGQNRLLARASRAFVKNFVHARHSSKPVD